MNKLLMTLPSMYSNFYSAWNSTSSEKGIIENLTSILLIEEAKSRCKYNQKGNISRAIMAKHSKWNKKNNESKIKARRN